jgi:hypothetical protein
MRRIVGLVRGLAGGLVVLAAISGMTACQLDITVIPDVAMLGGQEATHEPDGANDLVIENNSRLPDTHPRVFYQVRFHAHGGVPALHWRIEKGALPPGMKLGDDGLLSGLPEHSGEFQFTVSVRDSGQPSQAVQKEFVLRVISGLSMNWKNAAHVNGNRIEGSVEVSNALDEDMDLTFIVLAVASNGRATAIGYQHFVLRKGKDMELPFGDTLSHGGYVVHVDAVAEIAAKNVIYHERLKTPSALQVTAGP